MMSRPGPGWRLGWAWKERDPRDILRVEDYKASVASACVQCVCRKHILYEDAEVQRDARLDFDVYLQEHSPAVHKIYLCPRRRKFAWCIWLRGTLVQLIRAIALAEMVIRNLRHVLGVEKEGPRQDPFSDQ